MTARRKSKSAKPEPRVGGWWGEIVTAAIVIGLLAWWFWPRPAETPASVAMAPGFKTVAPIAPAIPVVEDIAPAERCVAGPRKQKVKIIYRTRPAPAKAAKAQAPRQGSGTAARKAPPWSKANYRGLHEADTAQAKASEAKPQTQQGEKKGWLGLGLHAGSAEVAPAE